MTDVHSQIVQYTPGRVRADARRELALIDKHEKKQESKSKVVPMPKTFSMFKPQLKDEFVPQ